MRLKTNFIEIQVDKIKLRKQGHLSCGSLVPKVQKLRMNGRGPEDQAEKALPSSMHQNGAFSRL
jgi:hypothetical protein